MRCVSPMRLPTGARARRSTAAYLARETFVDYAVYAKWRGKLVMG